MIYSAIAGFNVALSFGLVSSFLPIYLNQQGISLLNIGLIFAFGAMIAGIFRFPIGKVTDKIGRRPIMLLGAIGYPVFALGIILSNTTADFISIKLLIEIFGALFWTGFWAYVYDMLHKGHEGRELAWSKIIMFGLSGALAPFIGGYIIALYGFTPLFYLAALVGLINIIFIWMIVKDCKRTLQPLETIKKFEHELVDEYKHIINIKKFRVYLSIGILHNIVWAIWYVYMPIYLMNEGMAIQQIGIMISLLYVSYMITMYPLGKLIDKFPSKYLIIPGFLLMWLAGYSFLMFKDFAKLTLSRVAMGFGLDLTWEPMAARLTHITSKQQHGSTIGLFKAINAVAIGLTTVAAGYLSGIFGIKEVLWGASSLSLVIGLALIFVHNGLMQKGKAILHKHHVIHLHASHEAPRKSIH